MQMERKRRAKKPASRILMNPLGARADSARFKGAWFCYTVERDSLDVKAYDLDYLAPGEFLNDVNVSFYMMYKM